MWLWFSDPWGITLFAYVAIAMLSLVPTILASLKRVKLHPGGTSFDDCIHFSDNEKKILNQHYSRIQGTLIFWKNAAEKYRRFHYYCLLWTIPISILIPIITQATSNENCSKLFLTIVSSHAAILLGLHKGLKVENHFKSFRNGESEFYDLYRRFLDNPDYFGLSKEDQLQAYFRQVEQIRRYVRSAETDNFPSLEETMANMKKD